MSVIDPNTNTVATTINLTSFDEDPRPPFRLATGGVTPTHAAMVTKPLYHGAINIHGATPSPDNKLLACTGRGTSNVYLIDLETMKVIGNTPNSQAGDQTNAERLTSGVLVGREPHEPTCAARWTLPITASDSSPYGDVTRIATPSFASRLTTVPINLSKANHECSVNAETLSCRRQKSVQGTLRLTQYT